MPPTLEEDLETLAQSASAARDSALVDAAQIARSASSPAAQLNLEAALRSADEADRRARRYAELLEEQRAPRIQVRSEPLTYTRDGEHSFVRDLFADGRGAKERLARHTREMEVELPRYEARLRERSARILAERGIEVSFGQDKRLTPEAGVYRTHRGTHQVRTNPYVGTGHGGSFAPPLWIIENFASIDRSGRPLANLVGSLFLPRGVSTVNVPKFTGGAAAGIQPAQSDPQTSTDWTDSALTSGISLIDGTEDVAMQLADQVPAPGFDWVSVRDLVDAYDAQVEAQLVAGTNAAQQVDGLLTVSGSTAVAYTDGSPTGPELYTALGQLLAQTADARKKPSTAMLMRPARYFWLGSQQDNSGRPLSPPSSHWESEDEVSILRGDDQRFARPDAMGRILGVPAYVTDAIPATLGAGDNQDVVLALRPEDLLLWEGTPVLNFFAEVLSGTLQVRCQYHNSIAFIAGRHPTGIGILSGTGLVVQSGY